MQPARVRGREPRSVMPDVANSVEATGTADCQACKRHFLAISAAVVCLAGILLLLKVDSDIIVDEK